jgi:hypothetical protein
MIKIQRNTDKRADICKIEYILTNQATIYDYPGNEITVKGDWVPVKFSSVSFQETDEVNGEPVTQELSIKIAGAQKETEKVIRELCGIEIIFCLHYSNGESKVVGTEDNPVSLSHNSSGTPIAQTLYCKRNSPEKAKHLKSF